MSWKGDLPVTSGTELLKRCGLHPLPPLLKPERQWLQVTAVFLGAERYVLGTRKLEVSLHTRDGGFGLTFKKPLVVVANSLLGKHIRAGVLTDVELKFDNGFPTMSLAGIGAGRFPLVYQRDETVEF